MKTQTKKCVAGGILGTFGGLVLAGWANQYGLTGALILAVAIPATVLAVGWAFITLFD